MIEKMVAGIATALGRLSTHQGPLALKRSTTQIARLHGQRAQLLFAVANLATHRTSIETMTGLRVSRVSMCIPSLGSSKWYRVYQHKKAIMIVIREQELWAMALWVDREHRDEGERLIAERVLHFDAEGDPGGKQLWMDVARRFVEMKTSISAAPN